MKISDWSNLCEDLLRIIARRLIVPAHRVRFSAVCRWWQFIARSEDHYLLCCCPPPWLMLAENPNTPSQQRRFLGLSKNMQDEELEISFEVDFPEGCESRSVGSTGTWLIMVDEILGVHLRNPLTQGHIELPPISTFGPLYEERRLCGEPMSEYRRSWIQKAVLRWLPPDEHQRQDFIVVAIYNYEQSVAFTKRDSKSWTTVKMDYNIPTFSDVIFSEVHDTFYCVGYQGVVVEVDIDGGSKTRNVYDTLTKGEWDWRVHCPKYYLVECEGQVLQVIRLVDWSDSNDKTTHFQVYELDIINGERTKLKSLGRHSLFIGDNTSVALTASDDDSFHENSIYFTDNWLPGYGSTIEGGKDMGVFDMESGKIKPHCKPISPSRISIPLWLIPSNLS